MKQPHDVIGCPLPDGGMLWQDVRTGTVIRIRPDWEVSTEEGIEVLHGRCGVAELPPRG